eukprot:s89_g35.t1
MDIDKFDEGTLANARSIDYSGTEQCAMHTGLQEQRFIDPEIPPEKGFIWFRVVAGTRLRTGRAVQVQLLEDGVVPAWLDLRFLQAM